MSWRTARPRICHRSSSSPFHRNLFCSQICRHGPKLSTAEIPSALMKSAERAGCNSCYTWKVCFMESSRTSLGLPCLFDSDMLTHRRALPASGFPDQAIGCLDGRLLPRIWPAIERSVHRSQQAVTWVPCASLVLFCVRFLRKLEKKSPYHTASLCCVVLYMNNESDRVLLTFYLFILSSALKLLRWGWMHSTIIYLFVYLLLGIMW